MKRIKEGQEAVLKVKGGRPAKGEWGYPVGSSGDVWQVQYRSCDRVWDYSNIVGYVSGMVKRVEVVAEPAEVREVKIFRCDEHHPADGTYVVGFSINKVRIVEEVYSFREGEWCYRNHNGKWSKATAIVYWCEI